MTTGSEAPSGAGPRRRVVSLVPSSTETLLALGADVVACTRFCEQPDLAHVGGTKNPDVGAIVALAPDVVVLDREENRVEDHDELVAAGLEVVVSDVTDVDAALDVIGLLADAAGVAAPARPDPPPAPADPAARRTAFVPIWRRPWMTVSAGTYGASLLDRLGVDVVATAGAAPGPAAAYPEVTLDELAPTPPDLVLVPSEPYEFRDAHLDELRAALPGADVRRVDGRDLFWWGSRTPGALERLARSLGR